MTETPKGRKRLTPEKVANRVKWVEALLSGEYKQGGGQLRDDEYEGYGGDVEPHLAWCCLGVAGHCLEPYAAFVAEGSGDGYLPTTWAFDNLGLTTNEDYESDQNTASGWNDSEGFSFLQIADRVALATEKSQNFIAVTQALELRDATPGAYARAWLANNK